jgi:small subunit ribosomal protein S6
MSEVTKVYELTILLHPDLEIDLEKPLKKVEKIITDNGGKVEKQENWGKKKLAYPIQKLDFAVYVFNEVRVVPENANKIQNLFNITDEVLRYLMVEKDLKVPEAKAKKSEETSSKDKES